jgi:uncharacterized protein with HEPN domain
VSPREWIFRLQDMLDAARKIQAYINGMTFEQFKKDEKTFDAVIRQLSIIGEASSQVPEEIASLAPEIPWSLIRGMRNILVHQYFGVDARLVWKTARKNLPELCSHLMELQARLAQTQ